MRAISTKIKEETAVGRLILPNDHVDVLLTRRMRGKGGSEDHPATLSSATSACSPSVSRSRPRKAKKTAEGSAATATLS